MKSLCVKRAKNKMKTINERVNSKIDELFSELTEEHKLKTGDIAPMEEATLTFAINNISDVMELWLKNNEHSISESPSIDKEELAILYDALNKRNIQLLEAGHDNKKVKALLLKIRIYI